MPITDGRYDGEYTSADVKATRVGNWIIVRLNGVVRYRRLTRDKAFITARVKFSSNRSPRLARNEQTFNGAELRIQSPAISRSDYNNWIDVLIESED